MFPNKQIRVIFVTISALFLGLVETQNTPTCQSAGGFCWALTLSCPNGFRRDTSDLYSCAQVGQQCCVLVADCERNGGFCWSLNSRCPDGFIRDANHSNYHGCHRSDRQCCTKDDSPRQDVKSRSVCGLGSSNSMFRVLNGGQTGTCDWPFVVSIRSRNSLNVPLSYGTSTHACAGVLIDTTWVLTSPICVLSAGVSLSEVSSRLLVVAGEHNVVSLDLDPVTQKPLEQVIEVTGAYFEPRYPFTSQAQTVNYLNNSKIINSHGIALLRLKQPITGKCVGVACLPTAEEATNECAKQKECVILGWGYKKANFSERDDSLLKGNTRLTSRSGCSFLTDRFNVTEIRPEGSICQTPRDAANTDSCLGDEGGPILCAHGSNWVVRGVQPFNFCSEGNYQLWVTEVAPYLTWLNSVMDSNP